MLISGKDANNYKRDFIKDKEQSSVGASLPASYQSKKSDKLPYPDDHFERINNKLYINDKAINKQRENNSSIKLDDLVEKTDSILFKASTVWPFTLFANDIIVDPYKVNIIYREFLWAEHIHSVMIRDILDVIVETSVFFSTIKIVDQGYTENSIDLEYLKKDDALNLRRIIQGLVIAHRQAIDLSKLSPEEINLKAHELGKIKGVDDGSESALT